MSSALVGVLAIGLTLFFNFSSNEDAYAAVTNEYRTKHQETGVRLVHGRDITEVHG
ncbi:MAG: hypothetical protein IPL24_13620 [Bacteroidetes bacterium]|nr:hypothetical protein [Bacteroidota bacterium]